VISLIGALCYAELTTAYPHEGGDYIYLSRAFGNVPSFLYVWARMTVIQTGSIAMHAFIIGNYATAILSLGQYSVFIYAMASIIILSVINITGIRRGYLTQKVLFSLVIVALLTVIYAGITHPLAASSSMAPFAGAASIPLGQALIFVLLTYGGWTEAAFISHELSHSPKVMVRALIVSIVIIAALYMGANYAYLNVLGLEGVRGSSALGADFMGRMFGPVGSNLLSIVVIIIALSGTNAMMITGARSNFALGRDYDLFRRLGKLNQTTGNPTNAYVVQAIMSMLLITMGAFSYNGLSTMVDYITPTFWLFIIATICSLFVLRHKDSGIPRPFLVPLYPVLPFVFLLSAIYMFYSSVTYSGIGSMVGLGVLAFGIIAFIISRKTVELPIPEEEPV
jgi:basic amino acid/polyamine antiporter, APA family